MRAKVQTFDDPKRDVSMMCMLQQNTILPLSLQYMIAPELGIIFELKHYYQKMESH